MVDPQIILGEPEGMEQVFGTTPEMLAFDALILWQLTKWQADSDGDLLIFDFNEIAEESGHLLEPDDIRRALWFWRASGVVRSLHQAREGDDSAWCAVAGPSFLREPLFPQPPAVDRGATA